MKRFSAFIIALFVFAMLIVTPDSAAEGVRCGLSLCEKTILPSLFPFFVAVGILSELGLTRLLGKALAPVSARFFGVSGAGGTAFIVGLTGGYPLGAAYISDLCEKGSISRDEAENLLPFCSNSGPAFIIGAVGVGVFGSAAVGLFLYAVHILAAVIGGVILSKGGADSTVSDLSDNSVGFAEAVTESVRNAISSSLNICGFVIAFSVFNAILEKMYVFSSLSGLISARLGTELHWSRALLCGIFELGNGIGAMADLGITPLNLALAAFLLGWGGVSVLFQSFSVMKGIKIKTARYGFGRFLIALIGSALALLGGAIFC